MEKRMISGAFCLLMVLLVASSAYALDVRLDWYADGNYSHALTRGAIGQFVAVFSEPVKPGTFSIVIPDKRMSDPWGNGRFGVLSEAENQSELFGRKLDLQLIVQQDACCGSGGDYANRFVIKLPLDWTQILDTEGRGWSYFDPAINQLRLVARGFYDQEGNVVEDQEGSHELVALRDVVLREDTIAPKVIYQDQRVYRLGEFRFYPGTFRLVFSEPIQIRSEVFPDTLTATQYEERKYGGIHPYQILYRKVRDTEDHPVEEGAVVFGDYKGWNCLWRAHTEGKEVEDVVILDVDRWDEETRLRFTRNYGWHWFAPREVLSPGTWVVQILGIRDQAGNVMDYHAMEVVVKDHDFFSVTELTNEHVAFVFAEAPASNRNFSVEVEMPTGEKVALWARLVAGNQEAMVHFEYPLEHLPRGLFRVNGIPFMVE